MASDGPLEQQVRGRVRGVVVLEGAEVEGLVALAEVGGQQLATRAASRHGAIGADARVAAAQPHQPGLEVCLLADPGHQRAELPPGGAELLDVEVAEPGAAADVELGERHRQHRVGTRGDVVHDRGLGALGQEDHQPGEDGRAGGGDVVGDQDRRVEADTAGYRDDDRVQGEGVVERGEHVGPAARDGAEAGGGLLVQGGGGGHHHAPSCPLGREVADGDGAIEHGHRDGGTVEHVVHGGRRRSVATGGRRPGRQVEVGHAGVPPDLLGDRRQFSGGELLGGGDPAVTQPVGPGQGGGGGGGEQAPDSGPLRRRNGLTRPGTGYRSYRATYRLPNVRRHPFSRSNSSTSMRRFRARLASVSVGATGSAGPFPTASTRWAAMPFATR